MLHTSKGGKFLRNIPVWPDMIHWEIMWLVKPALGGWVDWMFRLVGELVGRLNHPHLRTLLILTTGQLANW